MENLEQKSNFKTFSSSATHPIIKICLVNLLIILFLAVSFEIYLRANKSFDHFKNNDEFIRGKKRHLNSLGYRDDEFSKVIKRDGNQNIIFAAGGSITYGSGVTWGNVYAKKLQELIICF